MAISIRKIKEQSKQLPPLQYGDDELNVMYYPNAFTPELEEEQERVQSGMSAGNMLINMCIPLIADWDLEDEVPVMEDDPDNPGRQRQATGKDGEPLTRLEVVPISELGMKKVPMRVLTDIIKAIGEDVTPGEGKKANSDGSFSRKAA